MADGTYRWASKVPGNTWHLSGLIKEDTIWCLDSALKLCGKELDLTPPKPFVQSMALLSGSLGNEPVPWRKTMPVWAHQGFVKRLVKEAVEAMDAAPLDYYRSTWVIGNGIFKALKPACVDYEVWKVLEAAGEGNVPAIRSFKPNDENFADPVQYDRFKTLTGRLTVLHGPQILTLKREHRHIIRSAYGDDGQVVALDFAALEARILLYEHGRKCDDVDLYGRIAKELKQDRKAIKGAVISELYGSSKWALGKHLGIEGKALNDFVKQVKAYFHTEELLARVKKQFLETGKVINRYGRPVLIDEPLDHIFISYYGQSTGVDVTMMGFMQIVDMLARKAPRARPIFLLHDALLLDVHNDDLPIVQAIRQVRVKGYVQKFPLRLEKIS